MEEAPSQSGRQAQKLFVGGLSAQTTTDALREHFSKHGRVVDAVVMSKQGRPRGFGFVTFETAEASAAAVRGRHWLHGRYVDVKRAVPAEQSEELQAAAAKIFVGGLPLGATAEDLRACFEGYCAISDAVVMADRRSKRSRCFGFVRFAGGTLGAQAAETVLKDATRHRVRGKWVDVKRAAPTTDISGASQAPGFLQQQQQRWRQQEQVQQQRQRHWLWQQQQQHLEHHLQMQEWAAWDSLLGLWGTDPASLEAFCSAQQTDEKLALSERGSHHLPGAQGDSGVEDEGRELEDQGMDPGPWGFHAPHNLSALDAGSDVTLHIAGAPAHVICEEDVAAPSNSTEFGSASEQSEERDDEQSSEENRPTAASRAVTPPPGRPMKQRPVAPPPGLGLEASPMKVECPSSKYAALGGAMPLGGRLGSVVGGFAEADGLPRKAAAPLWQYPAW